MTETTPHSPEKIKVALAGNPNAGKTTLFNALTGERLHVANYPGVTVDKGEAVFEHQGVHVELVDLPGTYSLNAYSEDERVTRRYITDEHPDLVVDVLDTSNLERNLYLAVQFMELGVPLLLVCNKSDLAKAKGMDINISKLSTLFGVEILETVGHKNTGMEILKDKILDVSRHPTPPDADRIRYGREIEAELTRIIPLIEQVPHGVEAPSARWLAIKLLENDEDIQKHMQSAEGDTSAVFKAVNRSIDRITKHFGDAPDIVIPDQRYGFISGACQEAVRTSYEVRHSASDRIDEVVTSRIFGIPIFLFMMYLLFKITFALGEAPMTWIEHLFAWLARMANSFWPDGSDSLIQSLLVDGILGGVGGVIIFLPIIMLLFAAIAFLEDSGYMARGTFIMDRFMHKIGLHGKSFIPMVIGFGCTVPAILATRTLNDKKDRLTTMLILPLFSCSARLPIYSLFISAFFPEAWRARILMLMYLIGILMAILLARLLRSTALKGESSPFVMELPPYRLPTVRGILRHTWDRAWLFVRKAGTIIVAASVVLWVLVNFPKLPADKLQGLPPAEARSMELTHSVAGRIGHALEPVMRPIGFDWKTTTALIGAVAAKEIFVAQLSIIHSLDKDHGTESLRSILQKEYSRLQGFCIMLFCLISVPCIATIAATRSESGSWKWAAFQFIGLTFVAYCVTLFVYQTGTLFSRLWLLGSGL